MYKISASIYNDADLAKVIQSLSKLGIPIKVAQVQPKVVEINHSAEVSKLYAAHPNMSSPPPRKPSTCVKEKIQPKDSFGGRLILSVFKTTPLARLVDFIPIFQKYEYQPTSVSAYLSWLLQSGEIVRVKRGLYRLPLPSERNGVGVGSASTAPGGHDRVGT